MVVALEMRSTSERRHLAYERVVGQRTLEVSGRKFECDVLEDTRSGPQLLVARNYPVRSIQLGEDSTLVEVIDEPRPALAVRTPDIDTLPDVA